MFDIGANQYLFIAPQSQTVAMVTYGCLIFGEHEYANKERNSPTFSKIQNKLFIGLRCQFTDYISEMSHGKNPAGSVAKSHRS